MKLKRIISLALVAALSVPFIGTMETKADTDGWSVDFKKAPVVNFNQTYDLSFSSDGAYNKYAKIILPKAGYIDLTVNFPEEGWVAYSWTNIHDVATERRINGMYIDSRFRTLGEPEVVDATRSKTYRMGLKQGSYVVEFKKSPGACTGGSYSISYTVTDNWEQEDNDPSGATPVKLGTIMNGNLFGSDTDSYEVRLSNTNPVRVYLGNVDVITDIQPTISFYNKNSLGEATRVEWWRVNKDNLTYDGVKNAWYVSYEFEEPGTKVISIDGSPYNNGNMIAPYTIEITQSGQSAVDKAISDAKVIIAKGYCARIRNKRTNDHIFTIDPLEAESLLKQSAIYEHETNADGSNSFLASGTKSELFDQPVYRIVHNKAALHNFTHDEGEVRALLGNGNWTADKGPAPVYYTISKSYTGASGIYRAFNPKNGKQHYCPETEYKNLIKLYGWKGNNDDKPYWFTN